MANDRKKILIIIILLISLKGIWCLSEKSNEVKINEGFCLVWTTYSHQSFYCSNWSGKPTGNCLHAAEAA
jgi:hypothetical protein